MNEIQQLMLELEAAANAAGGALTEEQALKYQKQINEQIGLAQKRLSARDVWHADAWFRPNELELLREYLSRSFYARCRAVRPVYNHLLISAAPEDLPSARIFAARIAAAEAEFFGEEQESCVRTLTEEQLLSCNDPELREALLHELGQARILLVPEFEALDLPRFETALDGLGIGRYAAILCVTEETAEEIRGYAANDYRLARYWLRHSYHYTDKTAGDAYEYACRQLEEGGLTLTEEFREKLQIYVEAVYPEAVLHGAAFVRDLLIRIEDTRASSLRFSPTLTAADVPYSRKAEQLAEAKATSAEAPKSGAELVAPAEASKSEVEPAAPAEAPKAVGNQRSPIEITNEDFLNVALQNDHYEDRMPASPPETAGSDLNILLLCLSSFPKNKSYTAESFWDPEKNCQYTGRYQLDQVPKKLAADLRESGSGMIDHVVMLCTDATLHDSDITVTELDRQSYRISDVSPKTFFMSQVKPYLNPDTKEPYIPVRLEEDHPAAGIHEAVQTIRKLIQSAAEEGKKAHLHMDIHGGLRDVQMVFHPIMSLLDTDEGECGFSVFTVVYGDVRTVLRRDNIVDIYHLVSGIREIIQYGRISSLERYVQAFFREDSYVRNILRYLKNVANGIMWCNVDVFDRGLRQLTSCDWRRLTREGTTEEGAAYLSLFIENIKSGFAGLLSNKRTLLDEIRWCMDKGFYQQAFALIESRMPDYLEQKTVFIPDATVFYNNQAGNVVSTNDQFNASIYTLGSGASRNLVNNLKSSLKRMVSAPPCCDGIWLAQQIPLNTISANSIVNRMKGPLKLKTGCDHQFNISFHSAVDPVLLVRTCVLHKILKDVRNDAMHTDVFAVNGELLAKIIPLYLNCVEELCNLPPESSETPDTPSAASEAASQEPAATHNTTERTIPPSPKDTNTQRICDDRLRNLPQLPVELHTGDEVTGFIETVGPAYANLRFRDGSSGYIDLRSCSDQSIIKIEERKGSQQVKVTFKGGNAAMRIFELADNE